MQHSMSKHKLMTALILSVALLGCPFASGAFESGQADTLPELQVVDYVDLQQYLGTWYEIASIPNWFQGMCASGTTATYTLLEDGSVEVFNQCYGILGFNRSIKGRAFVDDPETNAKLKVSFVSLFGEWYFFGKYWIVELGEDYEYAVVGHPTRNYGWILSRTCELDEELLAGIFERLEDQAYDSTDFTITDQSKNGCE